MRQVAAGLLVVLAACHGSRSDDDRRIAARAPAAAATVAGFEGRLDARLGSATEVSGRDDIDGDGVVDCWDGGYSGGSGFGGFWFEVALGCAGEAQRVDTFGSFGEFIGAAPVPEELAAPAALAGVIDWLFGADHRRCDDGSCAAPDGSFRWLIEELAARERAPLPIGAFTQVWHYTPRWEPGRPALPPSQVMLDRSPLALVSYGAHNHGALTRGGRCGDATLWTTAHGVALEDVAANRWTWVYGSTGVDKLRHPSIGPVACAGGLVLIERKAPDGRELVVVAPASGGVGSMSLDTRWRLDRQQLAIDRDTIPLATLAAQLTRSAWHSQLDFDGDGAVDRIEVDFSGGGHCCYTFTVELASGARVALPFKLDGGYVGGLDLSRPEHFAVADHDGDSVPDLLAVVDTYNAEEYPLSAALRRFGVRTHRVLVDFASGQLRIRDWPAP